MAFPVILAGTQASDTAGAHAVLAVIADPDAAKKRLDELTVAASELQKRVDSSERNLAEAKKERENAERLLAEAQRVKADMEGVLAPERQRLNDLDAQLRMRAAELDRRDVKFLNEHSARVKAVGKREDDVAAKESQVSPLHERATRALNEAQSLKTELQRKLDILAPALKKAS